MNGEWWKKIEDAYRTARELSGEERSHFLDGACKADAAMRRQIEVLLQQDENPDSFLNKPALGAVLVHRESEGAAGALDDVTVKRVAAGTLLGSYRIEAPIGEGGMGVVYRARDTKLNRPVAVKVLSAELADVTPRPRVSPAARRAAPPDP